MSNYPCFIFVMSFRFVFFLFYSFIHFLSNEQMGVEAAMVTGDNELVARNVAQQVGIKPEYPSFFLFFSL